uniref:Putative secreted protein n=1 Tax=Ixodes ricinus TaxID=34613 RepID=A0A6B0UAP7_IXORI
MLVMYLYSASTILCCVVEAGVASTMQQHCCESTWLREHVAARARGCESTRLIRTRSRNYAERKFVCFFCRGGGARRSAELRLALVGGLVGGPQGSLL